MVNAMITVEFNEKILEPIKYWISAKEVEIKRWFPPWRYTRTEYYLESPYGSLGPYNSEFEIRTVCVSAGISLSSYEPLTAPIGPT
jgi:hypothetical protein